MDRRNWLDLSRKLVDRFDLDYTQEGVRLGMGKESLARYGLGVLLDSPNFPVPFALTPSGANLTVSIGTGQAHDDSGQLVTAGAVGSALLVSDPANPRKSLLVLRFKYTGATPVPKPSDPISTVFLNLLDDYEYIVRSGVASGAPVYPATVAGDIVIAGFSIPANAATAAAATIDYTVSQYAPIRGGEWDAITGQSDATLAKALARLGAGKKRILVAADEALTATVNVTHDDVTLVFKPGVTFSDGGGHTGLNVTGKRCRIENGRFTDFTVSALTFAAGADYGKVIAPTFKTCTDELTDNTATTTVQMVANSSES